MSVAEVDVLTDAIAQRVTGAMSVPSAATGPQWKVKFLCASRESDSAGLWVQAPVTPRGELEAMIAARTPVEVAFKHGAVRATFRSVIARRDKHFWLTDQFMFDALLLESVEDLSTETRQSGPRLMVSAGTRVFAQVFRMTPGPQGPKTGAAVNAKIWDLGLDGATFLHPYDKKLLALPEGEPLRSVIHFFGGKLGLDAKLTFSETVSSKIVKFGVRFDPPVDALGAEVLTTLNEVLATLQRHHDLRVNLGRR